MKRLITVVVIAAIGFYVAWPAWSAYRIATAVTNQDEDALARKVDFPSVQDSLRPVAMAEIAKRIDKEAGALGPLGQALATNLKAQMGGKIVEQVLASIVTPRSVIRIAHEGGDIAASVEKAIGEAAGQLKGVGSASGSDAPSSAGGLRGILGQAVGGGVGAGEIAGMAGKVFGAQKSVDAAPAAPSTATATAPASKRSFGLGNVKGFGMAGPLSFNIAVAREASQPNADATIGMSFTGGDWKLTRVVPKI